MDPLRKTRMNAMKPGVECWLVTSSHWMVGRSQRARKGCRVPAVGKCGARVRSSVHWLYRKRCSSISVA